VRFGTLSGRLDDIIIIGSDTVGHGRGLLALDLAGFGGFLATSGGMAGLRDWLNSLWVGSVASS